MAILDIWCNDFSYVWSTSHHDASYQVSKRLAKGCWWSRLLKQIVDAPQGMTHNEHWPITIAHFEPFVLRQAKKK